MTCVLNATADELRDLHTIKGLSPVKIARMFDTTESVVVKKMHEYGISLLVARGSATSYF